MHNLLVSCGHEDFAGAVQVAGAPLHLTGIDPQLEQFLQVQITPGGLTARSVLVFGSFAIAHGRSLPVRLARMITHGASARLSTNSGAVIRRTMIFAPRLSNASAGLLGTQRA